MGENINPYKMLHDLNFIIRKYTGSPADPVMVQVNEFYLKIQGWLDWDGVSAPRIPGLVHLECETGQCCPLLGNGANKLAKDSSPARDSGEIEEAREKGATMYLKFKLRKATLTTGSQASTKVD